MRWRERNGVRWLEAALPGATAAFTTRLGGASSGPFGSLNLGALTEDDVETVAENRRRLSAALGFSPEHVAFAHQVHGTELRRHGESPCLPFASSDAVSGQRGDPEGGPIATADGHVLTEPGIAALVFVADCVPVALSGPGGVAMLHCGWRGLASSGRIYPHMARQNATAGLVERGVEAVKATAAVVGPSIGPCCYEVGGEVLGAFANLDGVADGPMLDLPEIARRLLLAAGVERVELSGLCTSCESELFFSHRRDCGRTGRQAGLVWLDEGEEG